MAQARVTRAYAGRVHYPDQRRNDGTLPAGKPTVVR